MAIGANNDVVINLSVTCHFVRLINDVQPLSGVDVPLPSVVSPSFTGGYSHSTLRVRSIEICPDNNFCQYFVNIH